MRIHLATPSILGTGILPGQRSAVLIGDLASTRPLVAPQGGGGVDGRHQLEIDHFDFFEETHFTVAYGRCRQTAASGSAALPCSPLILKVVGGAAACAARARTARQSQR